MQNLICKEVVNNMDMVEKCKSILTKNENTVFAYIFGSYVSGRMREDSDIDIAIYLSKEMDVDEYLNFKMTLTDICKREVDLIILNEATPLLKYQIYKKHILLFTQDKTIESNFKVKTLFEYNDVKRYLDLSYNTMIKRLKKEVESNG